jgi:predicted metal-dependent peptidase
MFRANSNKGFFMEFDNGFGISVQWGTSNYCSVKNLSEFSFDTDIYNPQDFTSDNLDDIIEYEPEGGGGTDFKCMFTYLKDNDISPKRLLVFTDGYPFGTWGDPNYCETLWVVHGNDNPNPPFGQWALYDNE